MTPSLVEGDVHLAAHLLPGLDFLVGEVNPLAERPSPPRWEQVEQSARNVRDPRHHHVGVRVVAQTGLSGVWVFLVELVRAHDAVDLVAATLRVEVSDAGPETGDLHHHLGARPEQEVSISRGLDVVPDVVEDGRAHVPLVLAQVRFPQPGARVEMHDLGLFLAVAATLPGVHRAPVAGVASQRAGLVEPAVPVHQQAPRDLRQPEVQEGIDVELVPEDVAAVSFPVEAARGNAGVQVGCVGRAGLQNVGGVEAQQELNPVVVGHPDVAVVPQFVPRTLVTAEGLVEGAETPDRLLGVVQGLVDRLVVRGVERDQLLDTDRLSLLEVEA